MLILSTATASLAATLQVPTTDYPTLQAAADAASSADIIEIVSAGTYPLSKSASGSTFTIQSIVTDPATVVVNLSLSAKNASFKNLTVMNSATASGKLAFDDVIIAGTATSVEQFTATTIELNSVEVDRAFTSNILFYGGSVSARSVHARNVRAGQFISAGSNLLIADVSLRCSTIDRGASPAIAILYDPLATDTKAAISIDGLLIADVTFDTALKLRASGHIANATIVGSGSEVGWIIEPMEVGTGLTISDVLLTDLDTGLDNTGTVASMDRLWMDDVDTLGSSSSDSGFLGDVTAATTLADPMLSTEGDPCDSGWWPKFGSPLVDAGDPAGADRDGSLTDIGATGGEFGVDIVPDVDDDGYNASRDCDDANPDVHPDVSGDTVGDGIDEDCDLADGVDLDGDGASTLLSGGDDCDDADAARYPSATDTVGDTFDQNCDGADGVDDDRDGAADLASGGDDCDDADPVRYPAAADTFGDSVDQNCDGADGVDADGDGHANEASGGDDCDDAAPQTFPGHGDPVGDGVDRNCDGSDGIDADGDASDSLDSGGDDCLDADASVHPGATDSFGDDIDQDCDGFDGQDADGDGHASAASGGDDCDDADPAANPGADEDKGGADLDCDGKVNPGCGCASTSPASSAGTLAFLATLLLSRRRR